MLGEILATTSARRLEIGSRYRALPLRIVGVFRAQDTFSTNSALLPFTSSSGFSDLGGKVAGFDVRLRTPSPGVSRRTICAGRNSRSNRNCPG